MRKRLLSLGIVMCIVGIAFAITADRLSPKFKVNETYMEQHAPPTVNEFTYFHSPSNPMESSPVDDTTWQTLDPSGIVNRSYMNADQSKRYDVLLVSSVKRESFHDPNVCLPSQGLIIENEHQEKIQTKTRGVVPLTIAKLTEPDKSASSWIAYFYRVQDGFVARSNSIFILTLAMFKGPLLHGNFDMNTVFYRFISQQPGTTKEEFLKFVADFLDSANEYSKGFF